MKGLSYSFLRAICALVIGLVLVMFPDQAGDYFVITIGVIFLVPSLISIIGYYAQAAEVRFPVSIHWSLPVLLPNRLKMKKICFLYPSEQC